MGPTGNVREKVARLKPDLLNFQTFSNPNAKFFSRLTQTFLLHLQLPSFTKQAFPFLI